jgi:hypothetical protein
MIRRNTWGPRFRIHGGNLRLINPELAKELTLYYGNDIDKWFHIDTKILPDDVRDALVATVPMLAKMTNPDDVMAKNAEYNKATLTIAQREAAEELRRKTVEESGNAQMEMYRRAGLADTERNSRLITEHIKGNSGVYCAATVRAAVEGCRINLDWNKVKTKPAAVVAPAAPQETLGTLPDGSKQLPLSQPCPRSATVAQARDWLARVRAQQQPGLVIADGFKTALR